MYRQSGRGFTNLSCVYISNTFFTASGRSRSHNLLSQHRKRYSGKVKQLPERKPWTPKLNLHKVMAEERGGWIEVGGAEVWPWSVAGLETCVVVRLAGESSVVKLAFDMGYPFKEAVQCQHVFISHGHIDHVSGLIQHASRRNMFSMKPPTYYMSEHLEGPLNTAASGFSAMHEDTDFSKLYKFQSVGVGQSVQVAAGFKVYAFPSVHRIKSQGYLVYKENKKVRPEYKDLSGQEIGKLIKQGKDVLIKSCTPEVAYTGDTTIDLFLNPPTEDLLKVNVLITEVTYIDDDIDSQGVSSVMKAKGRGHIHLQEIIDNAHLFANVDHLVLMHLSDKYSTGYIKKRTEEMLPAELKGKVHISQQLKEMWEQYC